jgi:hypothetical protein
MSDWKAPFFGSEVEPAGDRLLHPAAHRLEWLD